MSVVSPTLWLECQQQQVAVWTAAQVAVLLGVLRQVPDWRDPRGVRYELAPVLALWVAGNIAGHDTTVAVWEWACPLPPGVLTGFGIPGRVSSERTFRRIVEEATREKSHGRYEERALKALTPMTPCLVGFWGAKQAAKITRTTRRKKTVTTPAATTTEKFYLVTSLSAEQVGPADLAAWARGHWTVEAVHHVRDRTMDKDRHAIRTKNAALNWAIVRDTTISALRLAGCTNMAKAHRETIRDPGLSSTSSRRPAETNFDDALAVGTRRCRLGNWDVAGPAGRPFRRWPTCVRRRRQRECGSGSA